MKLYIHFYSLKDFIKLFKYLKFFNNLLQNIINVKIKIYIHF